MTGSPKLRKLKLQFDTRALAEWHKLDGPIRKQFKSKLGKLLTREASPTAKSRLAGALSDCYKIKLRSSGYRLVYRYDGDALVVLVVAIGKRERNVVYELATARLKS